MQPVILMPAYKPDAKLFLDTVKTIHEAGFADIVIVDDGSGEDFTDSFKRAAETPGVQVVYHAINMGKGRGIRTGFNYILQHFPGRGVITCDADGQHPVESVIKTAEAMEKHPSRLILAARNFFEEKVPIANLLGNTITRVVFLLLTGIWYGDTQCGLRGYPEKVMKTLMPIKGERYEFENTMLLSVRSKKIEVQEIPMKAVYIAGNATSHFNKVTDSARIYAAILPFAGVPFFAGIIVVALYYILLAAINVSAPYEALISAAAAYLTGWLIESLFMKRRIIYGLLIGIVLTAAFAALVFVLHAFGHMSATGAFWISAIPFAPLSYTIYMFLRHGRRPRIFKSKKNTD